MTDSLDQKSSELGQIRLKHIRTLVETLRCSRTTAKDYIRRRYSENASEFDVTLDFVTEIGYVHTNGQVLSLDSSISKVVAASSLAEVVIRGAFERKNRYRAALRAYIRQFRVIDDRVVYYPMAQQTIAESRIRNLLMDLSVVAHDASSGCYVLDARFNGLYAEMARAQEAVAPSRISERLRAFEVVGSDAEKTIISYEQQRLGEHHSAHVKHIAATNAAAGYDIESVTILSAGGTLPRLIEVKAVPAYNLRFYWTANEIATARQFGSWYFLYLLPTLGDRSFDLDRLQVIRDPSQAVLRDKLNWNVEPDVLRCELNSPE